jgi:hypothetical protein
MQAYCARCRCLRHVVEGHVSTVLERRLSVKGDTIIETVQTRRHLRGVCEVCTEEIQRRLDAYGARFMAEPDRVPEARISRQERLFACGVGSPGGRIAR